MGVILALETSTKNCSVALFKSGFLLNSKESNTETYIHAEQLTVFILEVLELSGIKFKEIKAVALSKGPGSYTGLRIGTSVAKGLCYALNIPLISISTLRAMAFGMAESKDSNIYCPMIDARRMEVFSALFDKSNNEIRGVQADIVNKETYINFLNNKVLFFGDGAIKCKEMINHKNATFVEGIYPSAKNLGFLAQTKFLNKDFEDIAYFEPYYLKDFLVGKKSV